MNRSDLMKGTILMMYCYYVFISNFERLGKKMYYVNRSHFVESLKKSHSTQKNLKKVPFAGILQKFKECFMILLIAFLNIFLRPCAGCVIRL